ncbi:MAG: hypothetical protein WBW73_23645, partial [Rhodoplanes sp.]
PVTTRINLHRAYCRCCGNTITAEPPADMPPGSPFGPGIVALVLRSMIRNRRWSQKRQDQPSRSSSNGRTNPNSTSSSHTYVFLASRAGSEIP